MLFTVLFYIFVVVTVIQIFYYLSFYIFAFDKKNIKPKVKNIPVSIIILIKNEEDYLNQYIKNILEQNYSNFEVVLVNNASSDNTLDVIENLQKKHSNIKLVNVKNTEAFWGSNKYALTLGIKAASYEHLLFTETRSIPISKNWINEMIINFSEEKTIVLGYEKIKIKKLSINNLLFRFDNILETIQSFSYTKIDTPYRGYSSNLAYTKTDFFKVNGFINHLNIFMGESDLFIKDAGTNKNTVTTTDFNSFVESSIDYSFNYWFSKKRKQSIITSLYKFKHQFFLKLFKITKTIFYLLAIFLTVLNLSLIHI